MRINVQIKRIGSLNKREFKALKSMTVGEWSGMSRHLREQSLNTAMIIAIARNERGTTLGWALNEATGTSSGWQRAVPLVQVYVKQQFRRQGIGKRLLETFHSKHEKLWAAPRDEGGRQFFTACGIDRV